jgi:DNA polymerase delta subunit 2
VEGDSPLKLNGTDAEMTDIMEATSGPRVRLLAIPKFHETGELLLVDSESLEVEVVSFGAFRGQEERK